MSYSKASCRAATNDANRSDPPSIGPCTAAQSAGEVDLSFDPGSGLNGTVVPLALQSDGRVFVGGRKLAQLNTNGSMDPSFDPGTGSTASMGPLVLLPDGKMLIAGFTATDAFNGEGIARLSPTGSLDPTFNPGPITPDPHQINSVVVQPDGKVLIGGFFDTVQGVNRHGISRLNADGTLDTSFDPGTGIEGPRVYTIALQPDGKILIGGSFIGFNGVRRAGFARLLADGRLDTTFVPPTAGPSAYSVTVRKIVLQPDGKILSDGLQRLNSDGTLDLSFSVWPFVNGWVSDLVLQPNDQVLICGTFTTVGGLPRNHIARLNDNGTVDTSFDPGPGASQGSIVAMLLQPDGKMLFGGTFTSPDGVKHDGIARLNSNGTLDASFDAIGSGPDSDVRAVVTQPDGKVLIGGWFRQVARTDRSRIARLNADGTLDGSFDPGTGLLWETTPNQTSVSSLVLQANGKVLIAGRFSQCNGVRRTGIARLHGDGTLDSTFNPILTSSTYEVVEVLALALLPNGQVLIGGEFQTVNESSRNRIARLNADGTLDPSFDPSPGPSTDSPVYPPTIHLLALQPDGRIIVQGDFTAFNGVPRAKIARLNPGGSLDSTFNLVTEGGGNGWIAALTLQPDSKVLIGGDFTKVNGISRNRIARVLSDGTLDTSFDPGTGIPLSSTSLTGVYAIALQPDQKILIGGAFTAYNNTARNSIARLQPNGSLDSAFDPGMGPNNAIWSMALQTNGQVVIGGAFTVVEGIGRWRVARLQADPVPNQVHLTAPRRLPNGLFGFTISGEPGNCYTIESSTDLLRWSDLTAIVLATNSFEFTDTTNPWVSRRFYRTKVSASAPTVQQPRPAGIL